MKVLIVCENATASFGSEAAPSLHYYRASLARSASRLADHPRPHARRPERALPPTILDVEDSALNRAMWQIGRKVPPRLSNLTFGFVSRIATQLA